jgi:hypothetical protein
VLLETVNSLVGGLPGDAVPVSQVCLRVVVQLSVIEELVSLLVHGNTLPGHGRHPPLFKEVLPMS